MSMFFPFHRPPCPHCAGTGYLDYGFRREVCSDCYGVGRKFNLLSVIAILVSTVALTVLPFILWGK